MQKLCFLFLILSSISVSAVIIQDTEFVTANWQNFTIGESLASGWSVSQMSGGNPGYFLRFAGGAQNPANGQGLRWVQLYTQTTLTPNFANNNVSIQYDYDVRLAGSQNLGARFWPFLVQGSTWFRSVNIEPLVYEGQGWVHFSFDLTPTSNDFFALNGSGLPNFTSSGEDIYFGIMYSHDVALMTGDLDNFRVEVTGTQIPEPASYLLCLLVCSAYPWVRKIYSHKRK